MGKSFTDILEHTVEELAALDNFRDLYHEHRDGASLPSADVLAEIIDLVRSIIFPGYYGKSSIDRNTAKYHIGVAVERVH